MSKSEPKDITTEEFAKLNRQLRSKNREIGGYKGKITQLQAEIDNLKGLGEHNLTKQNPEEPTIQEQSPHYVGTWHKYCPDCGEENPEFKDETYCIDCNIDIGAAERIADIKACPNCGKDHFKLKDGVELSNEVLEKLKSKGVQILER